MLGYRLGLGQRNCNPCVMLSIQCCCEKLVGYSLTRCTALWFMRDAVHPSKMMIISFLLYKARFDVYLTNAGDITIRIVLNRRDVSGQDRRIHASPRGQYTSWFKTLHYISRTYSTTNARGVSQNR